jgi:hypothetical protein
MRPTFLRLTFVSLFVTTPPFVSFVSSQTFSQRGYVDGSVSLFPQLAPNDPTRAIGDFLVREEVFAKPAPWVQFAGGLDLRANTHDQVDASWRLDVDDRGTGRPAIALRRLSATFTSGGFTLDLGKQFIRWGKTDIVNPTDRFAPRDFLNVITAEFLPVAGARATLQRGSNTLEGVWVPRLTPSRVPLLDQRWTVTPPQAAGAPLVDAGSVVPSGAQTGVRWNHIGTPIEFAASFFNGFNHLPNFDARVVPFPASIQLTRTYPKIRGYGIDAAAPTRWFTIKGEAEYVESRDASTDDYVLYVIQIERQAGEWVLIGGYAGEGVTTRRSTFAFAPDRGLTKSIVGRAAYTIDPRRSVAVEGAARQNGDGVYAKAEYSETRGQHWRLTIAGVGIAGRNDDFLGQYRKNSHAAASVRYSF